jgi:ABC-type uncharacterized transport system permease subunit
MLSCNVLLYDFQRGPSDSRDEVRVGPQARQPLFELWEFEAQNPTGIALQILDGTMDAELWINFQQQMHVVRHDFHLKDIESVVFGYFLKKGFQSVVNTIGKYLAAIFRTPNDMVLAGIDNISIALKH